MTVAELKEIPKREKRRIMREHKGLRGRVAKRCGVDPSMVTKILYGDAVSAPVFKELAKELAPILASRQSDAGKEAV